MLLEGFVDEKYGQCHKSFNRIGGGFYADVYRFDYGNKDKIIIKVYKSKGIMEKEVLQIQLLSQHALYPMPKVLWTHSADDFFQKDILAMNCLEGENGGKIHYLSSSKRKALAEQVVNNLIAFHNIHNPNGFGEINSDKFYRTFNECYKGKSIAIFNMAKQLNKEGQISDYVLKVVNEAIDKFDEVFFLPITESSLIHGDYNMWNIMVDKKSCGVTAVIDPCGCMWADSEYDLYQLNNANGKHLKLFDLYAEKKGLSENCRQKMAFYELFTEIEHYYNSGYPVMAKLITKQANALRSCLET